MDLNDEKNNEHKLISLSGVHEKDSEGEECGGTLEPISIWVKDDGSWEILKRCNYCGEIVACPVTKNDNPVELLSLAAKPLGNPPFPIDRLTQMEELMGGTGSLDGYFKEEA